MIEIKENEIIVSEDDVLKALNWLMLGSEKDLVIKRLGFKKDGV